MQLNMLEAMNIYVNVVEQGSFIRAAEVLELHRPAYSSPNDYFFLYAPYKSDTGVFSNIWISFLCALCSLKISARLLPPKARPIPVAAAESNVSCGMAREAIPNVAVPAKINPDETFFFFEFLMADSCDFPYSSTTLIKCFEKLFAASCI